MLVGKKAPVFKVDAYDGKNYIEYTLEPKKRPLVLVFYPHDFTFVCPTELMAFSTEEVKKEMDVVFISVDSKFAHKKWTEFSSEDGGVKGMCWPMCADVKREISMAYNVYKQETGVCARATFILDKEGIIKYEATYDDPIGRNIDEVLRIVRNIKYLEENKNVKFCPVNFNLKK